MGHRDRGHLPRNEALYKLADDLGLDCYDGMDVGPVASSLNELLSSGSGRIVGYPSVSFSYPFVTLALLGESLRGCGLKS